MARGLHVSAKRLQIDKANSTIVLAVGVAAFALTFSLVASKSLIAKQSYQNRVIAAQEQARDQLQANIDAVDELKVKYAEFVSRQENIISGNSKGDSERDGDNARIVLDALPSKYDFPGMVSSLEKILVDRSYTIQTIGGTDDEAAHNGGETVGTGTIPMPPSPDATDQTAGSDTSAMGTSPATAVEMPFSVGAVSSYKGMVELLAAFRLSIRPMQIQTLRFSAGDSGDVQVTIQGNTYYQPERTLNITEEVVQ